jgi:hypothetical protein
MLVKRGVGRVCNDVNRMSGVQMNARSVVRQAPCMGAHFCAVLLGGLLASLLAGCWRGPSGDEIVSQTHRILSEMNSDCVVDVAFNGVGEGDADNAYAAIHLETGPANDRLSKDVEVLVSDMRSGRWDIQQEGSTQLVEAAIQLCKR